MKNLIAALVLLWAGGVIQSLTYLAVWASVNHLSPHAYTYQMILLWPFYRVIDMISFCC